MFSKFPDIFQIFCTFFPHCKISYFPHFSHIWGSGASSTTGNVNVWVMFQQRFWLYRQKLYRQNVGNMSGTCRNILKNVGAGAGPTFFNIFQHFSTFFNMFQHYVGITSVGITRTVADRMRNCDRNGS